MLAPALLFGSVVGWLVAWRPWGWYMTDLRVYRSGGSAVLHGRDLYSVLSTRDALHFTYPPFGAIVMTPVAALPFAVAKALVSVVTVASVVVSMRCVSAACEADGRTFPEWLPPVLYATVIWLEPVRSTLSYGQIDALLMALVVIDLLVLPGSKWQGVLVGLASAIKLTPLAFCLFFVLTRNVKAARNSVLTVLASIAVSALIAPHAVRTYWLGAKFLTTHHIGRVENASNQSLHGILARLLRTPTVPAWWLAIAAAVLAAGLLAARRLESSGAHDRALIATAIAMLCASPISWSHHWVWISVILVACVDVARRNRRGAVRLAAATAVAPFATAMAFWGPHSGHQEFSDTWWQQAFSASYVLAGLGLLVLFELLRHVE